MFMPHRNGWTSSWRSVAPSDGGKWKGKAVTADEALPPPPTALLAGSVEGAGGGGNTDDWRSFHEAGFLDEANLQRREREAHLAKIFELEDEKKEDGTTSVRRMRLYLASHTSKKKNNGTEMGTEKEDDPEIVELQRMIENDPSLIFKDPDHDPFALVCGCNKRGRVRGLGGGISKTSFHAFAPSWEIAQREKRNSESTRDELKTSNMAIVQPTNKHKILPDGNS